ncbi:MAG: cell division protein FtsL [Lachnospiraceae bacterium]|nr:cell division protein FtsL [Lachnospiraceae bacterium]MBR4993826.1 cell division protein FtsL [Lachnospiraceae bacterium]
MTQMRTRRTQNTTAYRRDLTYVEGNVVRKTVQQEMEEPLKRLSAHTVRNRQYAKRMNPGYILFLTMAMLVTAFTLIFYIRLQSEITSNVKTISRLESELNTLRLSNDEAYSRATGNIDLEEVKRIAIGELGMTYATEGQIVTYSGEASDYVKQVAQIP